MDLFQEDEKEFRGRVDVLFYSSPNFSAGRLSTDSGDVCPFRGPLMVVVGDAVILQGKWIWDEKYGRQFDVSSFTFNQKMTVRGLAQYLEKHPALCGIGPVKARRIAEVFGEDFDRVIDEEPERVAAAAGLSPDSVGALRAEWLGKRDLNASFTWLASFDLTYQQITRLVEKFGNSVVTVLKGDPYEIVRELPGFGFKKVDALAQKMGILRGHPSRLRAGLLYCVAERRRDLGDCWVRFETLIDLAEEEKVLNMDGARERIWRAFDSLVEDKKLSLLGFDRALKEQREQEVEEFVVADPVLYQQERDLADVFKKSGRSEKNLSVADLDGLVADGVELNEYQQRAVLAAAQYNQVLLTGGAGSGKTFTIAAITRLYQRQGLHVVLAAPTGKAARRMQEVVKHPASTIHRLLKYNGRVFSEEKIPADVIIVDEVSMVDAPLAWYLFRAIDLSKTNVVLVGDHNQLPPVGPGNLLRDLVNRRPIPTVVLDKVVRQAGVLMENSRALLKGEVRPTSEDAFSSWMLADRFDNPVDARRFIFELFESVLVEERGFDLLADVQLLTPMKLGPLGTEALNVELQRIIQKKLWGVDVEPPQPESRPRLLLHDRVIQTKNNYQIGVMNGTIGTVAHAEKKILEIDFDGRNVEVPVANNHLSLAYALTFHKAQGSEFPCVVVVIHKDHSIMHHRNLFYTGVTRAQKMVIIVGDSRGMRNCAKKEQVEQRKTFLSLLKLPHFEERVG